MSKGIMIAQKKLTQKEDHRPMLDVMRCTKCTEGEKSEMRRARSPGPRSRRRWYDVLCGIR